MDKVHIYYIGYCFKEAVTGSFGYGEMTISVRKELKLNTMEDIDEIKMFIEKKSIDAKGEIIKNIVIMNFIELEDQKNENKM